MKHESVAWSWLGVLTVTVLVVGSLVLIQHVDGASRWLAGPSILMAGSLIPTLLKGGGLTELGLRAGRWRQNVQLTCMAGVVLGVLGLGGVSFLGRIGIELPLRVSGPDEKWVQWVLFQYVYAAFPEELFFRGYLMSGIMGPLSLVTDKSVLRSQSASAAVLVSAGAFALSHALVLGNMTAIVTFLPGLAFAWLFARTRSLVGPVLLHGTANIAYGLMAGAVA
jgi:membrane protease YdiL (CAAX protease family)